MPSSRRATLRLRERDPHVVHKPQDAPIALAQPAHEMVHPPSAHRQQGTEGEHCPAAIVPDYLDRYRDHLSGHPLARDRQSHVVAVLESTNNPVEHVFSQAKSEFRGRLGRVDLGCHMQD